MGILSEILAYQIGKRRGYRKAERRASDHGGAPVCDTRDPKCLNYESFCRTYGSCDGQTCEYGDE